MVDPLNLFRKAYCRYWDVVEERRIPLPCEMLPYTYKQDDLVFTYGTMEQEFTRELLNTINGFASEVNGLVLWAEVLREFEGDRSRELRHEFTRLPLYYCLHKPTEFRDRLI